MSRLFSGHSKKPLLLSSFSSFIHFEDSSLSNLPYNIVVRKVRAETIKWSKPDEIYDTRRLQDVGSWNVKKLFNCFRFDRNCKKNNERTINYHTKFLVLKQKDRLRKNFKKDVISNVTKYLIFRICQINQVSTFLKLFSLDIQWVFLSD